MPTVPMMDFVSFFLGGRVSVSMRFLPFKHVYLYRKGGRDGEAERHAFLDSRCGGIDGAQAEIIGAGFTRFESFLNRAGCYANDFVGSQQFSRFFVCYRFMPLAVFSLLHFIIPSLICKLTRSRLESQPEEKFGA
jgi:hypothetical protein